MEKTPCFILFCYFGSLNNERRLRI